MSGANNDNNSITYEDILHERFFDINNHFLKFNITKVHPKGNNPISFGTDPLVKGPAFMFFTKPDFNMTTLYKRYKLDKNTINTPFNNKYIRSALTQQQDGSIGNLDPVFNVFLTNACTGISGLPTIALDLFDIGDTLDGSKMGIPKSTKLSRQNLQIQLNFEDFHNGPIMMFHKMFVDCIDAVTNGATAIIEMDEDKQNARNYVTSQILCYPISIYYVVLEPDLRKIVFFSKFTGCYPISWPSDSFGGEVNAYELIKLSIPYYANFFEAQDDELIIDFNITKFIHQVNGVIPQKYIKEGISVSESIEIAKGRGAGYAGTPQSVYVNMVHGNSSTPPHYELVFVDVDGKRILYG